MHREAMHTPPEAQTGSKTVHENRIYEFYTHPLEQFSHRRVSCQVYKCTNDCSHLYTDNIMHLNQLRCSKHPCISVHYHGWGILLSFIQMLASAPRNLGRPHLHLRSSRRLQLAPDFNRCNLRANAELQTPYSMQHKHLTCTPLHYLSTPTTHITKGHKT